MADQYRPKSAGEVIRESHDFPGPPPSEPLPILPRPSLRYPRHRPILDAPVTFFCTWCGEIFNEYTEWQKHERFTHELSFYWPCPYPTCDAVFIKADKFESHHEESHGCLACNHAPKVVRSLPSKKMWGCGFDDCKEYFGDWEKRCQHVAFHYESFARGADSRSTPRQWRYSNMVRNLLRQPAVDIHFRRLLVRCHGTKKASWPALKWTVGESAELRRRLEYCDFTHGVEDVVNLAYRSGHPATTAALTVMNVAPADARSLLSRPRSRSGPAEQHKPQETETVPFPEFNPPPPVQSHNRSRHGTSPTHPALVFPASPLPSPPLQQQQQQQQPNRGRSSPRTPQRPHAPSLSRFLGTGPVSSPPAGPLPSPPPYSSVSPAQCHHSLTGEPCACTSVKSPTGTRFSMAVSESATLVDDLDILGEFPQPPELHPSKEGLKAPKFSDVIQRSLSLSPRPHASSAPPASPIATSFRDVPDLMKKPKTPKSMVNRMPSKQSLPSRRHDSKGEATIDDDADDFNYHDFAREMHFGEVPTKHKKLLTLAEFLRESPGPEYLP
jgi:uncharacterized C2H2 Zn-finger protein